LRVERAPPSPYRDPPRIPAPKPPPGVSPGRAGAAVQRGGGVSSPAGGVSPQSAAPGIAGKPRLSRTPYVPRAAAGGAVNDPGECETCKSRGYQDRSNDPSVSFQVPTRIDPGQAAASVASHESEHAAHERTRAEEAGRKIVSQYTALQTSICPECKRVYVSGGVTRTVTASNPGGRDGPGQIDLSV
jgi:hypothetical protein